MPLTAGTRIGGYEVIALIGAGGMGEVYRARDTRLSRDVALKTISSRIAADADAIARFEREARALASLNHPNIAAIYDVVEHDGQPVLVLELVEGDTLADRIAIRPIATADAIACAKQIADALDTAHESGIVHRDLKPANIKITESGQIKILDFGLAKAVALAAGEASDVNLANSPTISVHGTNTGVILGTAAYMSPEQARGKRIDKRTDIWAFGCVLFEMLTGRRAFDGETTSDVIAAIIERTPNLSILPSQTPPHLRHVLERCLEKDPKRRARDIADVRVSLDGDHRPPSDASSRIAWAAAAATIVAVIALGGAAWYRISRERPAAEGAPIEFSFDVSGVVNPTDSWPIASPDSRRIAFTAPDGERGRVIWIRDLQSATPKPVAGTEGVEGQLFWSPDGRNIGFRSGGRLKRVPIDGGPVQIICPLTIHIGATWGKDDVIVLAAANRDGLSRVSASGGELQPLTHINPGTENSHRWPHFLPDGRHFIYTVRGDRGINNALRIGSLDSPETLALVESQSNAVYADGQLLFVKDGTLLAQPFDAETLTLHGSARAVAGPVMQNTGSASAPFSASADGRLIAFVGGSPPPSRLMWFDRAGKLLSTIGAERPFRDLVLSHDDRRAAFDAMDPDRGSRDVWTIDLATGALTRITNHPATDWNATWSPDDREIIFASDRAGQSTIFKAAADGSGEAQLVYRAEDTGVFAQEWLPDGRVLFMRDVVTTDALPVQSIRIGASQAPATVATGPTMRMHVTATSPDARLMAYTTLLDGVSQVMVVDVTDGRRFKVSTNGGLQASWRRDGRELFYATPQGDIMAVAVAPGPVFSAPVRLMRPCEHTAPATGFAPVPASRLFAVSGDGRRVLAICEVANAAMHVTAALDWQSKLH